MASLLASFWVDHPDDTSPQASSVQSALCFIPIKASFFPPLALKTSVRGTMAWQSPSAHNSSPDGNNGNGGLQGNGANGGSGDGSIGTEYTLQGERYYWSVVLGCGGLIGGTI